MTGREEARGLPVLRPNSVDDGWVAGGDDLPDGDFLAVAAVPCPAGLVARGGVGGQVMTSCLICGHVSSSTAMQRHKGPMLVLVAANRVDADVVFRRADLIDLPEHLGRSYAEHVADVYEMAVATVAAEALRAVVQRAVEALDAEHTPGEEEAELWDGEEGHDDKYPECSDCNGHTFPLLVCQACGYTADFDHDIAYRPWPCPSKRVADELRQALEEDGG